MRITLNELLPLVDAIVEQAEKHGNQTIQEEWNEEKEVLHEGFDEDDWDRTVNEEFDFNVEWIISYIHDINLKSEMVEIEIEP